MQTRNPIFDDFARVFSGAVGAASGVRGEVEARVRAQLERLLADMDLVPREEFEAVQAMAAKAREEQEVMADRLAALEVRLEALEGEAVSRPKARSGSKDRSSPSEA